VARLSELLVEVRDAAARFEADRWSGDDRACVDVVSGDQRHGRIGRGVDGERDRKAGLLSGRGAKRGPP